MHRGVECGGAACSPYSGQEEGKEEEEKEEELVEEEEPWNPLQGHHTSELSPPFTMPVHHAIHQACGPLEDS